MENIEIYNNKIFEEIKLVDKNENEFWEARELQKALGYSQWRRFNELIDRAKITCNLSKINVSDHFANVGKIVEAGVSNSSKWEF